ncbi:MAG: hypothetical protein L3J41_06180 [Melioribacteraceae bacterium]|nr:hypothetical protein [Melioribacteraceae bacterium]
MRKIIFIILFLLLNCTISSQDFGLSAKYSINVENSYDTYRTLSFGGSYFFYNNMFEVGPLIGIEYSELKGNYSDIDFSEEKYYFIDKVETGSAFVGANLYFYPIKLSIALSPFIGIRGGVYTENRSLSYLLYPVIFLFYPNDYLYPGGNHISEPGLYNFHADKKYEFSLLTGFKLISKKGINVIFELEYQHRKFTLKYDEYRYDSEGWLKIVERHSEDQIVNAFNFGIGLQFVF